MVKLTISVSVRPAKLLEFTQALESLINVYIKDQGCLSYEYTRVDKFENTFLIAAEWETIEALEDHFRQN
jgi:quinol monooxygenase YgiN